LRANLMAPSLASVPLLQKKALSAKLLCTSRFASSTCSSRRGPYGMHAEYVQHLFSACAVHAKRHGVPLVYMYLGKCMTQLLRLFCTRMQRTNECCITAPRIPSSGACAWYAAVYRIRTASCARSIACRQYYASLVLHDSYFTAVAALLMQCLMTRTWRRMRYPEHAHPSLTSAGVSLNTPCVAHLVNPRMAFIHSAVLGPPRHAAHLWCCVEEVAGVCQLLRLRCESCIPAGVAVAQGIHGNACTQWRSRNTTLKHQRFGSAWK
jgi:hypothetical protein